MADVTESTVCVVGNSWWSAILERNSNSLFKINTSMKMHFNTDWSMEHGESSSTKDVTLFLRWGRVLWPSSRVAFPSAVNQMSIVWETAVSCQGVQQRRWLSSIA